MLHHAASSHLHFRVVTWPWVWSLNFLKFSEPDEYRFHSKKTFNHNRVSSRFAAKGLLILMASSSVTTGLALSKTQHLPRTNYQSESGIPSSNTCLFKYERGAKRRFGITDGREKDPIPETFL